MANPEWEFTETVLMMLLKEKEANKPRKSRRLDKGKEGA